jgi:hypothetical protein
MRRSIAVVALLAFGLAGGAAVAGRPAQAQQFSAELVTGNAAGDIVGTPGRLYAADRKVRIETPDLPDSFLLVDGAVPAAYLGRPAQRIFMDSKQSSRLTRLFVSLDPADPCRQWQIMAEVAGISDSGQWRCDAQGPETVDGRSTVKFTVISRRGRGTGWVDTELKFPVKIETEDGAVLALRNIAEAPQPADRFEIPSTYKKFDPRQVIEQMKRSDVWVEPPR